MKSDNGRTRYNFKIKNLYRQPNIVSEMKSNGVVWLEYAQKLLKLFQKEILKGNRNREE